MTRIGTAGVFPAKHAGDDELNRNLYVLILTLGIDVLHRYPFSTGSKRECTMLDVIKNILFAWGKGKARSITMP